MKKNLNFITIIMTVLLLSLTSCGKKADQAEKTESPQQAPTELKDSVVVTTIGVENLNILEVLNATHEVNEVSSAMGTFVKGIDGVENDMYTFWFFEINGEMATRAADKIMTTPSDTIVWYFRQPGAEPPAESDSL